MQRENHDIAEVVQLLRAVAQAVDGNRAVIDLYDTADVRNLRASGSVHLILIEQVFRDLAHLRIEIAGITLIVLRQLRIVHGIQVDRIFQYFIHGLALDIIGSVR